MLGSLHDSDGMLGFVDDRLVAVVSRLGSLHDDRVGWWFLEATFHHASPVLPDAFRELVDVEDWIAGLGA